MDHVARRRIPILGVPDYVRVPKPAKAELMEARTRAYERKTGFLPVIKTNAVTPDHPIGLGDTS
jgi:hypothetical protein